MNIWLILTVVLAVALAVAALGLMNLRQVRRGMQSVVDETLIEAKFEREKAQTAEKRAQELEGLLRQMEKERRPARFVLDGGMPMERIEEALRGTHKLPAVMAIAALLSAEVVELSDLGTDALRGETRLPDGTVLAGYTRDQRDHNAGGAGHVARILARLQELTTPGEEETEKLKG